MGAGAARASTYSVDGTFGAGCAVVAGDAVLCGRAQAVCDTQVGVETRICILQAQQVYAHRHRRKVDTRRRCVMDGIHDCVDEIWREIRNLRERIERLEQDGEQ